VRRRPIRSESAANAGSAANSESHQDRAFNNSSPNYFADSPAIYLSVLDRPFGQAWDTEKSPH
jgi:hypothetical protein